MKKTCRKTTAPHQVQYLMGRIRSAKGLAKGYAKNLFVSWCLRWSLICLNNRLSYCLGWLCACVGTLFTLFARGWDGCFASVLGKVLFPGLLTLGVVRADVIALVVVCVLAEVLLVCLLYTSDAADE